MTSFEGQIKRQLNNRETIRQKQISWLVLLFSIFVLTPFLLFFQYHKMLEKNKEWN
jgi:hypothetical protein